MLKGKSYYKVNVDPIAIPLNLQFQGRPYTINYVHPSYHVEEYYVIVNNHSDNIVLDVILSNCFHPNAYGGEKLGSVDINKPPKYSKFCLPDTIINRWKFNTDPEYIPVFGDNIFSTKRFGNDFLRLWAMDNPHHFPDKNCLEAEYKYLNTDGKWITMSFSDYL